MCTSESECNSMHYMHYFNKAFIFEGIVIFLININQRVSGVFKLEVKKSNPNKSFVSEINFG